VLQIAKVELGLLWLDRLTVSQVTVIHFHDIEVERVEMVRG
jgi:hypothetical protein